MRILALETATLAGSAALLEDGKVVGLHLSNIALTHSERLMAMIDDLLRDSGWDIARVEALPCRSVRAPSRVSASVSPR